MFAMWRMRRRCFHHDRMTGVSWVREQLTDMGMGKTFWCFKCGKVWFI